jgi:2-phosphosulfolactate phosphatase
MNDAIFAQSPHKLKLDWGWRGCASAAARGEIIVIVDVLRFSTACAAATARDISIVPAAMDEQLEALARDYRAELPPPGFSRLSPDAYEQLVPGTRLVVKSPNGATCARLSEGAPHVLIGALVNASTVARRITELTSSTSLSTTVIACGERWSDEHADGKRRFAIEDYLGAGAIISMLHGDKSAEAIVCESAFLACKDRLSELTKDCASGRELIDRRLQRDVEVAATLDLFDVAPELHDGVIS